MTAADQLEILQGAVGIDVVIQDPDGQPLFDDPLTAVKGSSTSEQVGEEGIVTLVTAVDWLFTLAQFEDVVPAAGCRILWDTKTYTVTKVDFHGSDETCYRIHTVRDARP